jgi:hypothetical protein
MFLPERDNPRRSESGHPNVLTGAMIGARASVTTAGDGTAARPYHLLSRSYSGSGHGGWRTTPPPYDISHYEMSGSAGRRLVPSRFSTSSKTKGVS